MAFNSYMVKITVYGVLAVLSAIGLSWKHFGRWLNCRLVQVSYLNLMFNILFIFYCGGAF